MDIEQTKIAAEYEHPMLVMQPTENPLKYIGIGSIFHFTFFNKKWSSMWNELLTEAYSTS